MNGHFTTREICPTCLSPGSDTLFASSYVAPPIRDYLRTFYADTGGGVEFEYLEGAQYVLKECRECRLIYQYEVPGAALMQRLYERWLDPQRVWRIVARERSAQFYLWCAAEITRVLRLLNRPLGEVKFLDFGMGWGNWCLIAKGFGCEVYGTELSQTRQEYAQQMGIQTVDCAALPKHRFDFINAEQVFEHLADPLEVLRHLRRALSPGGFIRINVPPGRDIKRRLANGDWSALPDSKRSLNDVAPLQHLNCFSFRSLVEMANLAGLEEIKIDGDLLRPATVGGRLKAVVGPLLRGLLPYVHEARRRRGTNLCFRPVRGLVLEKEDFIEPAVTDQCAA